MNKLFMRVGEVTGSQVTTGIVKSILQGMLHESLVNNKNELLQRAIAINKVSST